VKARRSERRVAREGGRRSGVFGISVRFVSMLGVRYV
jgi:hypothetical protein